MVTFMFFYPPNQKKTSQEHNIAVYMKSGATSFTTCLMEGCRQCATGDPERSLSLYTHDPLSHTPILREEQIYGDGKVYKNIIL